MNLYALYVFIIIFGLVHLQFCPTTWTQVYKRTSRFDVCVKRLPDPVTWSVGEESCKDWIATPLAWNETLQGLGSEVQSDFIFQEEEVWDALYVNRDKFFYSGEPDVTIGVDAFYDVPTIQWGVNQPNVNGGDCVSISNTSVQTTGCSRTLYMYCQKHLIRPDIKEVPTYCPGGFVGNVNWNTCYKFINDSRTFDEAKNQCSSVGAELMSSPKNLLDRSHPQTAEYQVINTVNQYFSNVYASSLSDFVYWYEVKATDVPGTNDSRCGRLQWVDGITIEQKVESCDQRYPFMCQTPASVTESSLKMNMSVIEWTSDRLLNTACSLSRPLSAGETIHFSINDRPIPNVYAGDNTGRLYLAELEYLYPQVDVNGIHRCLVTGLHKRQRWYTEIQYQYPESMSMLLHGSIRIDGFLSADDVARFNLSTQPEKRFISGSPTYNLQESWSITISDLREAFSLVGLERAFASTRVTGFRENVMSFDIMIRHYSKYTKEKELQLIKSLTEEIIMMLRQSGSRKKRQTNNYRFNPDSLNIGSTRICGGVVFVPELESFVEFRPVPYGSSTESKEKCITDKRPLVTAECHGAFMTNTELQQITVNPKCVFKDLSQSSVSDALRNITQTRLNDTNVKEVVDKVRNLTSDISVLTSVDVIRVADILVEVSHLTTLEEEVVSQTLYIINDVTNVPIDKLRISQDEGSATNRLLEVVEDISKTVVLNGYNFTIIKENIAMEVYDLDVDSGSTVIGIQIQGDSQQVLTNTTIRNIFEGTDLSFGDIDAAIVLPEGLINKNKNKTRVALNIYRNWNLFSVRSDIREYLPNSRVLAASIFIDGTPVQSFGGDYKVRSIFHPREMSNKDVCGYWDYGIHDTSGGWATDGCKLSKTDSGKYMCVCDHLTNFAVLVNIGGQETLTDSLAITIISWIGLILSIIGLSLTILTFLLFKHLKKGRAQQTLFNLALSLLCFLVVFIVGIEQTQDYYGCIAVAVLIHYFVLVAFMWMLMEGILQYLRFVKVLGTYIPKFILKTAVPSWGIPLIPVIIVLAYDHHLYHGGDKACWMSLPAFYYAFVIPVALVITANAIVFIMIIRNLMSRPKGLQSNQSEQKRAMMNLRAAISVFVLLGLTWIFGFFTIQEASVVFQYIFVILNVFQGFLVFILFTAREKQVRQSWRKLCCKEKTKDKYKYESAADTKSEGENYCKSLSTGLSGSSGSHA